MSRCGLGQGREGLGNQQECIASCASHGVLCICVCREPFLVESSSHEQVGAGREGRESGAGTSTGASSELQHVCCDVNPSDGFSNPKRQASHKLFKPIFFCLELPNLLQVEAVASMISFDL